MLRVSSLRIVRRLHVISNITVSGTAKGLDGEDVSLLHLGLVVALHNGHGLGAVDAVGQDVVTREVADALDGVCGSVNLDLVALHDLLDDATDFADAGVNTGLGDTGVGRRLDGREKVVVLVVKRHGKGRVDDAAVDVDAEIHLHDILLLQDHLVARIGGVMRGAVVQAEASREAHTGDLGITIGQSIVTGQSAHAVLDAVRDVSESLSGLDGLLRPSSDLSVDLGGLAEICEEVAVEVIEMSLLLVGSTVTVVVLVFDLLALGISLVREELADQDTRGVALAGGVGLLLLLGLSLLLLGGAGGRGYDAVGLVFGIIAAMFVAVGLGLCLRGVTACLSSFGHCGVHVSELTMRQRTSDAKVGLKEVGYTYP